jgi:3-isopropylmalate dehydratase small subunit
MKHGIEVTARHCLEAVRPEFALGVRAGDVIVAGPHFGIGSSREQAASVLVHLGLAAVIAPSYSGLYFRNAFNVGLLLLTCPEADRIGDGEAVTVDARAGLITRADGSTLRCDSIPGFLLDMVDAGGLLPQLKRRSTNHGEIMSRPEFDLLIKGVRVVRPQGNAVHDADIAIAGGKIAKVAPAIDPACQRSLRWQGRLAFPGVVDAHMHSGIYSPLEEDAVSESKAAAMGGVTSSLNYFRTGQYYLNKGGRYAKFFLEVLKTSKNRFHVDYGYHLAPMDRTHIDEIPMLIEKHGVASFKIFMFYGSHGLHGASDSQREFLMIGKDERYDVAHFEFVMRGIQAAREKMPERASRSRCRCIAKRPRS